MSFTVPSHYIAISRNRHTVAAVFRGRGKNEIRRAIIYDMLANAPLVEQSPATYKRHSQAHVHLHRRRTRSSSSLCTNRLLLGIATQTRHQECPQNRNRNESLRTFLMTPVSTLVLNSSAGAKETQLKRLKTNLSIKMKIEQHRNRGFHKFGSSDDFGKKG